MLTSDLQSPARVFFSRTHSTGAFSLLLLLLTAAYFAAGTLGLRLAFVSEHVTGVWPPAGIAIGAMLLCGARVWPAVALGALLVNLNVAEGRFWTSVLIASGNTAEALAGYTLATRFAGGAAAFERADNVFRFALFAGILAPIVSATTGVAALLTAGLTAPIHAPLAWFTWWLGDAVGIVLVAPLMVMWTRVSRPWTVFRGTEFAFALLSTAGASWLVFGASPAGLRQYPISFLAVPVLFWPAFRLGAREAATATVVMGAMAVYGTLNRFGPFVRLTPDESVLFSLAFIGVWTVVVLAVSAEVETREAAEADTRKLADSLEARVAMRTEELSRLRDRLSDAQRVASVGSWEWDVQSNAIWWSDELFRIFRLPAVADRSYESYVTLLHPDDRVRVEGIIGKALADGRPFSFEHRIQWPDGSTRTIQADGYVIMRDGAPERLVGTGRDITDLRRADDERVERIREQAARLEAEEANRAKDEFLAILSHELRTPLNAALGWMQMLRHDKLNDARSRTRAAEAIMRNLQAQARLVSDMMDASHIALRTLRLQKAPVDMADVVRGTVHSLRASATARRIQIATVLPATPVHVLGDDGRLQQIVWNLVSNAAKFSRDGGVVTVTLATDGDRVRLVVDDEGPGIDEEFLPRLFERFSQADSSATREHGGLGLGLAIARHLVDAHGGTIQASNRVPGGASFTVTLPAMAAYTGGPEAGRIGPRLPGGAD